MSATSVLRRATTSVVAACAVVAVVPLSISAVHASTDRLRVSFDNDAVAGTVLTDGAVITDLSGQGNNGVVMTAYGGSVLAAASSPGIVADFPGKCRFEPCPNALVQIADSPSLDPLTADFEWGARVLMQANEVADGENVVQKGLFEQVGGQWKLQVDKYLGLPSCVVSGRVPGQTVDRRIVLKASVGVADGVWHRVVCRRTAASGLQIFIDGVLRGSVRMQVVNLASDAPLTIGAKAVEGSDNDQFLGVLDDVFMTVLDNTPVPVNTAPVARFTSSCVDQVCSFDATTSTDDGPFTDAWDFGDGTTDTTVNPVHTYAELGDHVVTLTLTDGAGLTNSLTQTVTTAADVAPVAAFTAACTDLACTFDGSSSTDAGPLTYAWAFGDAATATGVTASHTYAAGTYTVQLTVTDGSGAQSSSQQSVTVTAPVVPPITFVGQASTSGQLTTHVANIPSTVVPGDGLLLFFSSATNTTVKAPVGWIQLDALTNTNGSTRVWRRVAVAGDAGAQVRIVLGALSKGAMTIVAYHGTSAVNPVASFARTLITTSSANRTTPIATVASPSTVVSYWVHKDSSTTALTAPAGVTVRAAGTEVGGGRVTVLTADSGTGVPAGPYGGLTARAAATGPFATTWTIVLAAG
jgi:PKD repeat protein